MLGNFKNILKKPRLFGDNVCVWTLREIMPLYVVNLVRSLYPNPQGQPYMGHKWWLNISYVCLKVNLCFWLSLPVHSGSLKRSDYPKQLSAPPSFFFECLYCS